MLEIIPVNTRKEMSEFAGLPYMIYARDRLWVPPLRFQERGAYIVRNNPVLARSEHVLFLARNEGRPAGRIIAYIDPNYNDYYKGRTGMFGCFEALDFPGLGEELFRKAEDWLRERGVEDILGPINPAAESWGFLLEGDTPPVVLSPHNPLYYNRICRNSGYEKAKDLLVYEADTGKGYSMPARFSLFADRIMERRRDITERKIDRKNLKRDAGHILRILNESVAGNWGFVPVGEEEMNGIMRELKPILDEKAIWFVEDRGVPVGTALGFPDINVALKKMKGRITPFSLMALFREKGKIRDYRLWGLAVLPAYHGLGLDVLLYVNLFRALECRHVRMEANYMLEDNRHILNALEKLGLGYIKKYRVYRKELLG